MFFCSYFSLLENTGRQCRNARPAWGSRPLLLVTGWANWGNSGINLCFRLSHLWTQVLSLVPSWLLSSQTGQIQQCTGALQSEKSGPCVSLWWLLLGSWSCHGISSSALRMQVMLGASRAALCSPGSLGLPLLHVFSLSFLCDLMVLLKARI